MYKNFSDDAEKVMAIALEESRAMNHDFIGTEHILLALLREPTGATINAMKAFNITADAVRNEIEKLVNRGEPKNNSADLPLTPRARRAIEFSVDDAQLIGQTSITPANLLLGLLREQDGVAGRVLQILGLHSREFVETVIQIRLQQLRIVERIVRPVRASTPRKRKMREEMLAHLEGIYQEERAHQHDPLLSLKEAARRLGNPADLSRELEAALPRMERFGYRLERQFGWRPPESAARWMFRVAFQMSLMIAMGTGLIVAGSIVRLGWGYPIWFALRPAVAMLIVLPAGFFGMSLLYFKTRDSLFGVFGARKSMARVFLYQSVFAILVLVMGVAWIAFTEWDWTRAMQALPACLAAALATAVGYTILARTYGRTEIRDTIWACLDLGEKAIQE